MPAIISAQYFMLQEEIKECEEDYQACLRAIEEGGYGLDMADLEAISEEYRMNMWYLQEEQAEIVKMEVYRQRYLG